MSNTLNFIDSDAHVIEPRDMFERYLEPKYRGQMPVAWVDYQGDPLALGFEVRIPKPSGGEYVMPFGNDPLTGMNRIDAYSRLAAFDGGSRLALGPIGLRPYTRSSSPWTSASAASVAGNQKVISMVRYRAMAVNSSVRDCTCCPVRR